MDIILILILVTILITLFSVGVGAYKGRKDAMYIRTWKAIMRKRKEM